MLFNLVSRIGEYATKTWWHTTIVDSRGDYATKYALNIEAIVSKDWKLGNRLGGLLLGAFALPLSALPLDVLLLVQATLRHSFESVGLSACRFLDEHAGELGALADATVGSLGWADRQVLSVSPDTAAFDAMVYMSEKAVSALAVVHNGRLIGVLSLTCITSRIYLLIGVPSYVFSDWGAFS